ncbi:hypothetical protein D9613_002458 [Agrocybe pediades]|uniref:Uncharacterized protein n=1 Tax=Agrocybe pediades TaxID=84607 RepID=A0A8H4QPB5_9AGAR|nr:hypothetical protein D9613_002458 [Agrocybe pediades]
MSSDNTTVLIPDNQWVDAVNLVSSTTVASTAYGIMFTLYLICCYFLSVQMDHRQERRRSIFLISYITVMFALGTIYVATTTQATMISYVYFANFPGGPSNYNNIVLFAAPEGIANTISYVLANWMADAMLLWRLFVLFYGVGFSFYTGLAVFFPILIYIGSLAMGFMFIIQNSLPNGSLWASGEVSFALPYFVLSVSMSIIATALMLWRILSISNFVLKAGLRTRKNSIYGRVSAILVESCALYAVFSLIFIVLFAINHPIQFVFLSALANVQIIAPLLIIFRVSQGKAWTRSTTQGALTDLDFHTPKSGTTHVIQGSADEASFKMNKMQSVDRSTTLLPDNDSV